MNTPLPVLAATSLEKRTQNAKIEFLGKTGANEFFLVYTARCAYVLFTVFNATVSADAGMEI